ncbi:flavin-containing monooxygenase [Cryptosporangium aurantiacum]|uniref:Predicted flavoprotein CzcO associated with the cation diffusion facilitator CzcD n=1 Tax=Cryptosporangium aurantiacum TaxID=134849 RepID=A0A1M7MPC2_9ACTN|nr:NAD(P)/FAD-dependent oxidoreductase [Cryptosporangium aurantiacum]SHM92863.1 Predicted flavoprotein CzcO associated with the cation diffusion facilitator CzcD [Cryptosporangium aurantiacum]
MSEDLPTEVRVLVVGAGFGGLAAAAQLRAAGYRSPDDLLLIERADQVGGTWRDNTYPECACDVQSVLYSFSFAANPDWTRSYGRQPEILDYLIRITRQTGLLEHVRFGCELIGAAWDAASARWVVETSRGVVRAQVLVAATGALSAPRLPDLPGMDSFTGDAFHSARWNHSVSLAGKRVGVVGTGASAVQFVPAIAPSVSHLTVFQRTPGWVIPRGDRPYLASERALYRRWPVTQKISRGAAYLYREGYVIGMAHYPQLLPAMQVIAESHLRKQVPDPELRAKLRPPFKLGCKRALLSDDWFPALQRPNVELVTSAAAEVTPHGLIDATGRKHELDVLIFGTGFTPTEPPVARLLSGKDGRTLAESWDGSPRAYLGLTVHGFPNMFLMYGPNTNLGHSSIVYMLESQARYIVDAVRTLDRANLASLEVRADVEDSYVTDVQRRLGHSVWNKGGCASWYLDRTGRNSVMWPTFTWRYRQATRRLDVDSYHLKAVPAHAL